MSTRYAISLAYCIFNIFNITIIKYYKRIVHSWRTIFPNSKLFCFIYNYDMIISLRWRFSRFIHRCGGTTCSSFSRQTSYTFWFTTYRLIRFFIRLFLCSFLFTKKRYDWQYLTLDSDLKYIPFLLYS